MQCFNKGELPLTTHQRSRLAVRPLLILISPARVGASPSGSRLYATTGQTLALVSNANRSPLPSYALPRATYATAPPPQALDASGPACRSADRGIGLDADSVGAPRPLAPSLTFSLAALPYPAETRPVPSHPVPASFPTGARGSLSNIPCAREQQLVRRARALSALRDHHHTTVLLAR